MPATHKQTFPVYSHACDAFGYVKNVSYLQWMQEAAFAASAAVGYDFAQYHHIGQLWLVRQSNIEVFKPLKYGDTVEIKTWVKDIRRFRSIRAYEIRDIRTESLVAQASTDWVYLDTQSFRPVTIPRSMQLAFFPEGVPEKSISRQRFPKYPAPSGDIPALRIVVMWDDLDMMWHVNNATYLNYMDEAEKHALAADGWSMQKLRQHAMRIDTQQQRIEYLHPAVLGDVVTVNTLCSGLKDELALRHYAIRRESDGLLLVQAVAQWGIRHIETGEFLSVPEELCR